MSTVGPTGRTTIISGIAAAVLLAGCGGDGSTGTFDEAIEVDDLTITVSAPYRRAAGDPALAADVVFETETVAVGVNDPAVTPDPTLTCDGEEFEIDGDVANYAHEVSGSGGEESGSWGWTDGGACDDGGSFDVGGTTFEFSEVAIQD